MTRQTAPPNFSHPALKSIWAAITTLEPALMLELHSEVERRLSVGDLAASRTKNRRAEALMALRVVASELGHAPSVGEYQRLRRERPELELPADSSVRTRLGSGWNACLQLAGLDPIPDGDVPVTSPGPFSEEQLIAALKECHADLGEIPTVFSYSAWAARPDVEVRPGKRPKTVGPFARRFGGFPQALRAAGIAGEVVVRRFRIDPNYWRYDDDDLLDGLREIAKRLGYTPTAKTYKRERAALMRERSASGEATPVPSVSAISKRFRFWSAAVEAAGLPPAVRPVGLGPGPKGPRLSDETLVDALRAAYREVGEPFTHGAYDYWRRQQLLADASRAETVPSPWTIEQRFGGWTAAVARALGGTRARQANLTGQPVVEQEGE